jgi:hypothetical protein
MAMPLLWCFSTLLTGTRVAAYRDTAHFYYPLYAWTSQCWSRGEIPLWNPQDNIGTPIAAEATSAVFYPLQLIFALPLAYPLKFNLYLVGHFALAAAAAYALALHLLKGNGRWEPPNATLDQAARDRLRQAAAGLAGVTYVMSGVVLFQYCNVVFVVGAAWLPLALLAADRMLMERRLKWAVTVGVCLALMVLGGEPQMAYHAGMLAALLAWLRYRAERRASGDTAAEPMAPPKNRHALVLLATAAIVALLLSAVQVVPAVSLTLASDRVAVDDARSTAERLFGHPPSGTHQQQLYDFSVAPWRVFECIWPNVSGSMFPVNRRWLSALRCEDRIWTPTLYLGLLPLVLAIRMFGWQQRGPYLRWLSLIAVCGLLASFGWYGLGWLANEFYRTCTGSSISLAIGKPTGGLYWAMVNLLPAYEQFRYPAKLLTVATLAVALLAALSMERSITSDRHRTLRWLAGFGLASFLAAGAFTVCGWWWSSWFVDAKPDELFGPLDVAGAWRGSVLACVHTVLLCGLFCWLLCRARWSPVLVAHALVLITAAELAVANARHVLTAPASTMQTASILDTYAAAVGANTARRSSSALQRIYRPPKRLWVPADWPARSDRRRGQQTVQWDRTTLMPKYHLATDFGSVKSFNTLRRRDYRVLWRAASSAASRSHLVQFLGARFAVLPANAPCPGGTPVLCDESKNVAVWQLDGTFPRCWVVHRIRQWSTGPPSGNSLTKQQFRELLMDGDRPRDLRRIAFVENLSDVPLSHASAETGETCRVVAESACRIELQAELSHSGLVILSNQYDPGWSVTVHTPGGVHRASIVRVNGIMQGVCLPAGQYQLVFRYLPRSWYVAMGISAASWLLCLSFGAYEGLYRRLRA